jgi:hypothetical protein
MEALDILKIYNTLYLLLTTAINNQYSKYVEVTSISNIKIFPPYQFDHLSFSEFESQPGQVTLRISNARTFNNKMNNINCFAFNKWKNIPRETTIKKRKIEPETEPETKSTEIVFEESVTNEIKSEI